MRANRSNVQLGTIIRPLFPEDDRSQLDSDGDDSDYCGSDLISFSEGSTVSDANYEIDEDLNARLAARVANGDLMPITSDGYVINGVENHPVGLQSQYCEEGFLRKDIGGEMSEDWPLELDDLTRCLRQYSLEPNTSQVRPIGKEDRESRSSISGDDTPTFNLGGGVASGNDGRNRNLIEQSQYHEGLLPILSPLKGHSRLAVPKRARQRNARKIKGVKSSFLALQPKAQTSIPNERNPETIPGRSTVLDSVPKLIKENHNCEVRVGNLPAGITLKTLLSKVRGGVLDRVCYRKDSHDVLLVFFKPSAAHIFYQFIKTYPLAYPIPSDPHSPPRPVKLFPFTRTHASYPYISTRDATVLGCGATRCFFIGFLPDTIGVEKIEIDIMERLKKLPKNPRHLNDNDALIESIEVVLEPGNLKRTACTPTGGRRGGHEARKEGKCVVVKLASISLAFGAIGDFRSRTEYLGVELSYVEDDCAGPLPLPTSARGILETSKKWVPRSLSLLFIISYTYNVLVSLSFGAEHSKTENLRFGNCQMAKAARATGLPSTITQTGLSSQDHREVFLGNLPLFMDSNSLVGWIRGGQVDTIRVYHNPERCAKEAVIFFTWGEGARRYYNFIVANGMYISGRKVEALMPIPDDIKTNHKPHSFLRGQPPNGITRFVKISGVKDYHQILRDIMETCEQRPIIESLQKSTLGSELKDVTIQFMGMGDAVRTMIELKRFNSYRSLPSTYVRDPCGNNVMELARFNNRGRRR